MKKILKELLSLDAFPCDEACRWAKSGKFDDKFDMVVSAKDEWRSWVGTHTADRDILKTLAADQDSDVRKAVAQNANTPVDTLQTLAADQQWDVRKAVAQNANTPVE